MNKFIPFVDSSLRNLLYILERYLVADRTMEIVLDPRQIRSWMQAAIAPQALA